MYVRLSIANQLQTLTAVHKYYLNTEDAIGFWRNPASCSVQGKETEKTIQSLTKSRNLAGYVSVGALWKVTKQGNTCEKPLKSEKSDFHGIR